jgi:hypothetical protein
VKEQKETYIKQSFLGIKHTHLHGMFKERRQKLVSEKIKKQNTTEDKNKQAKNTCRLF